MARAVIRGTLFGMLLALIAPAAFSQAFDDGSFNSTVSFSDQAYYFGTSPPPPVNPVCSYRNGIAIACNGSIVSVYLSDGEAPTAGIRYQEGFAYTSNGRMYVATWPSGGGVRYLEGFAVRSDGVRVISTGGTRAGARDGISVTSRGETLATESAPTRYVQGIGVNAQGYISITDTN